MRDARLGINRAALHHNLRRVREAAPYARVMAMVKADAYGHGARLVAETLAEADAFGVALVDEGLALRAAGIRQPITVLEGAFSDSEMFEAVRYGLDLVVHQEEQLGYLERCRLTGPVNLWLKLDSGMHRLGFAPMAAVVAWRRLRASRLAGELGLLTHFACADALESPMTERQIAVYREVRMAIEDGRPLRESLCNSAGILAWPVAHGDWVRPGLMLYGSSPFPDRSAEDLGLRPVMTLSSRLIAVRELRAGEPVGYGASWVAPRDTRIGVVGIGYGDGYPRTARSGTPVLVNGVRVPLAGRVSMDMITVDLGEVPAKPGDPCILWGEGLSVDEVAAGAGTLGYELFCKITSRVRRDVW